MMSRSNARYYFIIIACVLAAICLVNPFDTITKLTFISWDGAGYYFYLPATFIYKSFRHMEFLSDIYMRYNISSYVYSVIKYDNGNYVFSYTMGVALLQMPFFLLSHLIAMLAGYTTDGFSLPYQWGMFVAGVFYTIIGAFVLFDLLSGYYSRLASLLATLSVLLGTNLYYYGFGENTMTHCYLFFLFACILSLMDRFYQQPKNFTAVIMGLCAGLMVLVRPTVAIALVVLFFWKVNSFSALKKNLEHLLIHRQKIILATSIAVLPLALQIFYWHFTTGQFLFNSYDYTDQYFDFIHPHLFEGLLSFEKGWLVYTPIVWLFLMGFFVRHENNRLYPAIALYLAVQIWIVFSWWNWQYGGGFSARAMVETYVVLAFPFAGMVDCLRKNFLRFGLYVTVSALIALNLFQTWQYEHDIFPNTGTKYEYIHMFGKTKRDFLPSRFLEDEGYVKKEFISNTVTLFDTSYMNQSVDSGSRAYENFLESTVSENQFVGVNDTIINEQILKPTQRLRYTVEARHEFIDPISGTWARLCISFERDGKALFQQYKDISRNYVKDFGSTTLEMQVPPDLKNDDVIKIFTWNQFATPLYIRRQKLELLDIK